MCLRGDNGQPLISLWSNCCSFQAREKKPTNMQSSWFGGGRQDGKHAPLLSSIVLSYRVQLFLHFVQAVTVLLCRISRRCLLAPWSPTEVSVSESCPSNGKRSGEEQKGEFQSSEGISRSVCTQKFFSWKRDMNCYFWEGGLGFFGSTGNWLSRSFSRSVL